MRDGGSCTILIVLGPENGHGLRSVADVATVGLDHEGVRAGGVDRRAVAEARASGALCRII